MPDQLLLIIERNDSYYLTLRQPIDFDDPHDPYKFSPPEVYVVPRATVLTARFLPIVDECPSVFYAEPTAAEDAEQ